jgi:D-alanine--poly(phosphoribitol) ligase subunit 2
MVRPIVTDYMQKAFLFEFDDHITDSTDLFQAGVMDSYGYLELMQFIQSTFEIELSRDELLSNVTTSLAGIVGLVESRLGSRQAQVS